jgi:hypothetical protein
MSCYFPGDYEKKIGVTFCGPSSTTVKTFTIQTNDRCSLPSCTAMSHAEPRCRDAVCRDDGGRPTSRYTAMSRGRVGRLHHTLPPTSDRSRHTLPTFAGPLLPCALALACYVLFSTWEYCRSIHIPFGIFDTIKIQKKSDKLRKIIASVKKKWV